MRRNLALRIILERNLNRELLAIWRVACPPDAVITRLEAEHLTLVAEAHRVAREVSPGRVAGGTPGQRPRGPGGTSTRRPGPASRTHRGYAG